MAVRRSCCGFVCVLIFELLAWALAVIAVATSFWLCACGIAPLGQLPSSAQRLTLPAAPSGDTLPGVSHAGLWLTCSTETINAAAAPGAQLQIVKNSTISSSIDSVKRDLDFARLKSVNADGCTSASGTYERLNGHDHGTLLTVVRALALAFLGLGLLKVLSLLLSQCVRAVRSDDDSGSTNKATPQRSRGCNGRGCTTYTVSFLQTLCGWAAWGLFLYILIDTANSAPPGHRSVTSLWGYSFWLFLVALLLSGVAGGAICCV